MQLVLELLHSCILYSARQSTPSKGQPLLPPQKFSARTAPGYERQNCDKIEYFQLAFSKNLFKN